MYEFAEGHRLNISYRASFLITAEHSASAITGGHAPFFLELGFQECLHYEIAGKKLEKIEDWRLS